MMRLLIALILSLCLAACAGTTVRMAKRYGHISADAQRAAVSVLQSPAAQKESSDIPADGNRPRAVRKLDPSRYAASRS